MKILSCNSNRPLAEAISAYLGLPLMKASVRRFSDMEVFVEIHENVRGEDVFVIQSTSYPANDNLMELLVGERVRIATQILGADDKRLHLGHEMLRAATGERSATQELMFLHIDLKARRVSPFPPELRARVAAWTAAHAALPRPAWSGRRIGLPG